MLVCFHDILANVMSSVSWNCVIFCIIMSPHTWTTCSVFSVSYSENTLTLSCISSLLILSFLMSHTFNGTSSSPTLLRSKHEIFDWPTLLLIHHSRSNHHLLELDFRFRLHHIITQDSICKIQSHPTSTDTMNNIVVNLPYFWIIDLRYIL